METKGSETRKEARQKIRTQVPKKKSLGRGKVQKRVGVSSIKLDDGSYRGVATTKIKKDKRKLKKVNHKIKTNYVSNRSRNGEPIAGR